MLRHRGFTSSTGNQLDQIAASVAPPRFAIDTRGHTDRAAAGSVIGIQSPQRRRSLIARRDVDCRNGRSRLNAAGAEFQIVTSRTTISVARSSGSDTLSSVATTRVAPAANVPYIS